MAEQRTFSRFRLPWLSAAAARPAAEPQPPRPVAEPIQAPAQPAQRPPFRPAGIAPAVSSPPLTRIEPQPATPPRATRTASVPPSPSRVTSQPVSPTRAVSEAPAASQTRSPSRAAPQPRAASVPPSPTRTTSQPVTQPQFSSSLASQSQPSSPSRTAPQVQPTVSQATSSPKKLPFTSQETLQPQPISTQPPPPASQQEPKPAVLLPSSQAAQPKVELKPVSEPSEKVKETKEAKEVEEHLKREEKTNGPAEEEPLKSAITKLLTASGAEGQAKELVSATFHSEQKQQKEDKKSSGGEYIKTVSSTHTKARNKLTESHQKPGLSNGEQIPLHKEIRDDISKFIHNVGTGQWKCPTDEKLVSVVTIVGENRGASMYVGTEPARKEGPIRIHRGYKPNPDDSTGATTDVEGSTKGMSNNPKKEDQAKKAYVNSNVQSINNSMLFDSSMTERSPGVQLEISHNLEEPTKPSAKTELLETRKAEFNVTPAQKLTYEPTVRRRCLRGLFLESSDSDPDNPEKPRRHGCRYNCGEKSKDRDINVL